MRQRILLFSFLFASTIQILQAQITITGVVKNEKGAAISYATIRVKETSNITIADTFGVFGIKVKPNSTLIVNATGYFDTSITINDASAITVFLKPNVTSLKNVTVTGLLPNNTVNTQMIGNALHDYAIYQNLSATGLTHTATLDLATGKVTNTWSLQPTGRLYTGTSIPVFTHKEETKGSRYLFDKWVKGAVMTINDTVVNNPNFLFNYDKIAGELLFTQDRQLVLSIDKMLIKSFALYDDAGSTFIYEQVPAVWKDGFVRSLSGGPLYYFYKLTQTKFVKSDYHSDGLVSTGNPYDEFADENSYYVFKAETGELMEMALKKKSIKQVLNKDADTVNNFFSDHKEETINEDFVRKLIDYLNYLNQ